MPEALLAKIRRHGRNAYDRARCLLRGGHEYAYDGAICCYRCGGGLRDR